MKKLLSFTLAIVLMSQWANASGLGRTPKKTACTNYSTTITTVTTTAATLYGVIIGTGAAGEFLAVFDSGSASGLSVSSSAFQVVPHIFEMNPSSITAPTLPILFDPPIEILNGLMIGNSAATGQACVLFEQGRGTGQ